MKIIEVTDFAVHSDYQGKGIGTTLLKQFIVDMEKDGRQKGCFITSTVEARQVYESLGWRVLGEHRLDFGKFGLQKPYIDLSMIREWSGVENES